MVFGLALVLALVVGVATVALAAVPGDPLELGQANIVDVLTWLTGAINNPMPKIDNSTNASATAVEVDPRAKVANVNADEVDGEGADEIGVNGWEPVEATSAVNWQSSKGASARYLSEKPPYPR